jgi:hypothetical protein
VVGGIGAIAPIAQLPNCLGHKTSKFLFILFLFYFMATITKKFDSVLTEEKQKQLDEVRVNRKFFIVGETYGKEGSVKGEWRACVAEIINNADNTRKFAWQVGFYIGEEKTPRETLSKSFLLTPGTYDADDVKIDAKGDVRAWADKNIISGKLEKEWCAELATILNEKGLKVEQTEFPRINKETGSRFTAKITHPYFAK